MLLVYNTRYYSNPATESLEIASSKNASLFKGWKIWWKNENDDDRWNIYNGVKVDML